MHQLSQIYLSIWRLGIWCDAVGNVLIRFSALDRPDWSANFGSNRCAQPSAIGQTRVLPRRVLLIDAQMLAPWTWYTAKVFWNCFHVTRLQARFAAGNTQLESRQPKGAFVLHNRRHSDGHWQVSGRRRCHREWHTPIILERRQQWSQNWHL